MRGAELCSRAVPRASVRWLALAICGALGCGGQAAGTADAASNTFDASEPDGAAGADGAGRADGAAGVDEASVADGAAGADGAAQGGGSGAYFPAGSWFLEDVYDAPAASTSKSAIGALRARGGWGNQDVFQIDFELDVLSAEANAPTREFVTRTEANGFDEEFYSPDCDQVPMPLPSGGNVEGEQGYACSGDGDCHLLVWVAAQHKLYEMWRADISGARFVGGCLAVWDTARALTAAGRGLQCSSADAAGFPIAPLLFTADEVQAGAIEHAIRFVLPNDRPRRGFVPPATHATDTTGPAGAPYYGVHLRLRRDYPVDSLPNQGAKVVARALQHYGMYHADGGQIALTAQSDRHTQHKWSGLLGPHDLKALKVEDFEVIDHGPYIPLTDDCAR